MKTSFAFDKATSPVSRVPSSNVTKHPSAQYMCLCHFTNTYWEFDRTRNNAPSLIFEGDIERMDAIEQKFPQNIDSVYFSKNKPRVRFDYKFKDEQFAALASKGFWSEDGIRIPDIFTTSKFQLEVDASVDEITKAYAEQQAPILNVTVNHPYNNTFNDDAYELTDMLMRNVPDEDKSIRHKSYHDYVSEYDIRAEVEAAKAAAAAKAVEAVEYVPLTNEEIVLKKQSNNVYNYVEERRAKLYGDREVNNTAFETEQARILAEQQADTSVSDTIAKVQAESAPVDSVATQSDVSASNQYESENNANIFNNNSDVDDNEPISADLAEFMHSLGGNKTDISDSDNKKNNNDSSTTSGTQTATNGYTFEDTDTEQHQIRSDVNHDILQNDEAILDETSNIDDSIEKTEIDDAHRRKDARFAASINTIASNMHDDSSRSK